MTVFIICLNISHTENKNEAFTRFNSIIGMRQCIFLSAQTYLLGAIEPQGQAFIDSKANKVIRDSFKQSSDLRKIYCANQRNTDLPYQSVIKQLIVDCKGKTIAIRGADYFAGQTSNSKLVKNLMTLP